MKTIITLLMILSFGLSFAQTTLIPDAAFEQKLIQLGLDTGTANGSVPTANIDTVTILDIGQPWNSNNKIADITGIEDFTFLRDKKKKFYSFDFVNNKFVLKININ